MLRLIIFSLFFLAVISVQGQYTHKIKADSVRLYNDSCNAELILESSTRSVPGFLYNKGNGRTEFRRAMVKLNDSLIVFGSDTLKTKFPSLLQFSNGIAHTNNIVEWGADTANIFAPGAYLSRPSVMNQNAQPFQWITGGRELHLTDFPVTPYNGPLPLSFNIPFRISHSSQGFMYLENNFVTPSWNSPSFGILFGNRASGAKKFDFFGQQLTASIVVSSMQSADLITDVPAFNFFVAGDTLAGRAMSIIGSGNTRYGKFKYPTVSIFHRLSIGTNALGPYNEAAFYPETRLYVNARNEPFIWKELPWDQSKPADTVITIDHIGAVRKQPLKPKAIQVLADNSTITWNVSNGLKASVVLNGNRILLIQNLQNGDEGTIIVRQGPTGGRTLTLPTGSLVENGGNGLITLSSAPNATDLLSFLYDGTKIYWFIRKNFTSAP